MFTSRSSPTVYFLPRRQPVCFEIRSFETFGSITLPLVPSRAETVYTFFFLPFGHQRHGTSNPPATTQHTLPFQKISLVLLAGGNLQYADSTVFKQSHIARTFGKSPSAWLTPKRIYPPCPCPTGLPIRCAHPETARGSHKMTVHSNAIYRTGRSARRHTKMPRHNLKRPLMNHTRFSCHLYKTPACGRARLQIQM